MHDDILTAGIKQRLDLKQNRTWLNIKTLAEGEGEICQWKCTADHNRDDYREILMEVWSGG